MDWLHWKTIDWAATGTMLQGIGTIIGAIAVIVAALVGRNTFRSWKRQQIVQRHMDLAERILTLAVRAQDEIRFVRSPLKTAAELIEAEKNLEANGFNKEKHASAWRSLQIAQASLDRLSSYHSTWSDLETIKPSAYVHFGEIVSKNLETIINQIHIIRADATAYAEDNGQDPDFSRKLRNTLSFSRSPGNKDELGDTVADAVGVIQSELQPLLKDVASVTNLVVKDFLTDTVKMGIRVATPF